MAEIIPNQVGQTVKQDKEEEIIETGGEKVTDEISEIKLIEKQEYNSFSNQEKELWVEYNPSLTSQAYVAYLNKQNELIEQFNKLGPIINKAPSIKSLEYVEKAIKPVETIADTVDPLISTINSIASMPIVGVVAQPLMDIMSIIGGLAAMLYTMMRNPYMMMKEYKEAFDSIDIDAVKKSFSSETSPNLEIQQTQLETMVIPDDEIKAYVNKNIDSLKKSKETIEKTIKTTDMLKEISKKADQIQKTIDTVTIAMGAVASAAVTVAKQEIVDSFNDTYDMTSKDYKEDATNMANGVNNFIHNMPQKYIKISDLENLKKIQQETDKNNT